MKVFLCWSGDRSYEVAKAFEEWLPKVIQVVDPFISSGIPKGKRWEGAIADELEETKVGILCLTRENLNANWILFEAGALSKTKDAYVCTFLLDLKATDIEEPLASFQHTASKKEDIRQLMDTINNAVKQSEEHSLGEKLFNSTFDMYWTELEAKLKGIKAKSPEVVPPSRDMKDMVEEILGIARKLDITPYSYSSEVSATHKHFEPYRGIDNRDIVKILSGRKEDDTDNNEDSK